MSLILDAIRFVQKKIPMYLAALPIDALDNCSIDKWDPKKIGNWKGYQRGLVESKIANLAQYLERKDGILPVAGLLNVRERNRLKFKGKKSSYPIGGKLTIPDYTQLWVVDMQHRLEGIKAAFRNGHLKEFFVPVLITEGLDGVNEAVQFYVINTKSTRMGVDLTRRLLIEHDKIKGIADVKEWELNAVRIAIYLNKKLKDNNP
jgi:DGQHR domain-containing protein